ncbi:MAG: prepilin-type N-terminal cleavage/methylation domain-containing protein [Gammaproteobacteria bacterium]|nr:prepilin-type N-terminal cleavage/methylation domain-containing protein [Gammaproteobacteria bacterium]
MMNMQFPVTRQRGFSLIEVMISALIISVGLLALAKFQGDLLRSGSDAKARSLALALAQEKMDDLRDFQALDDGGATWTATYTGDMFFSWIASHEGGRLDPTTAYSAALESGGVQFTRDWVVSPQTLTGTATTIDYNVVDITVAWQQLSDDNANAEEQSVTLRGIIAALDPKNTAAASSTPNAVPPGPDIVFNPGAAPEIIAIPVDVGEGLKKETSKPLPDVDVNSGSNIVDFNVITWVTTGGNNVIKRKEEFRTINCECQIASSGLAYAPARVEFDSDFGGVVDVPGAAATKLRGESDNGSQPDVCDICCRDHHDNPADLNDPNNLYDPFNTGSAHAHYEIGSASAATVPNADYDEVCRMKKVEGIWRVFWDWNQIDHNVLPYNYLIDGASTQTDYKNYVSELMSADVKTKDGTTTTAPDKITWLPSRDVTLPAGGSIPLLGRTLFIDYMTATHLSHVTSLISNTPSSFLVDVPFYEVNLTKLSEWDALDYPTTLSDNLDPCPAANMTGEIACVTNEDVEDEGPSENNYSRGLIVAGDTDGARTIASSVNRGNSGITGTPAVTPSTGTVTDSIVATVDSSLILAAASGQITFCSGMSNPEKNTVYDALTSAGITWDFGACTVFPKAGNSGSYSCNNILGGIPITVTPGTDPVYTITPSSAAVTVPATGVNFQLCIVP